MRAVDHLKTWCCLGLSSESAMAAVTVRLEVQDPLRTQAAPVLSGKIAAAETAAATSQGRCRAARSGGRLASAENCLVNLMPITYSMRLPPPPQFRGRIVNICQKFFLN